MSIDYLQVTYQEFEKIGSRFCKEHGDDPNGIIPDAEYDRLFDHLGEVLSKYGSYSDTDHDVDFSGYRYVDQIPVIQTVDGDDLDPSIAIKAAVEAVSSAHRPLGAAFDCHPHYILVTPPNHVFATYAPNEIHLG